jgi:3-oxoacyl-[acyl-carrier protein] reductase
VVVYLASDAAAGINGQVFGAGANVINRLAPPIFEQTITSEGAWDIDALFERFPLEFGRELPPAKFEWPGMPF